MHTVSYTGAVLSAGLPANELLRIGLDWSRMYLQKQAGLWH